ncbi:hypothetical protein AVEN_265999-1 [Araneus ventricosus]|uniref:Uncharacterized protein n=1 Tax=Araneus ventricosus TaxID=182803 RepID=A0A4Y2RFC0_ARAVE|nr:hypothetical protein AVEN_265999-1 [Araneus ventricosus]
MHSTSVTHSTKAYTPCNRQRKTEVKTVVGGGDWRVEARVGVGERKHGHGMSDGQEVVERRFRLTKEAGSSGNGFESQGMSGVSKECTHFRSGKVADFHTCIPSGTCKWVRITCNKKGGKRPAENLLSQ